MLPAGILGGKGDNSDINEISRRRTVLGTSAPIQVDGEDPGSEKLDTLPEFGKRATRRCLDPLCYIAHLKKRD